jgi:hypothetical protein
MILGLSQTRGSQPAAEERMPVLRTTGGHRVSRQNQLELVANARKIKQAVARHSENIDSCAGV